MSSTLSARLTEALDEAKEKDPPKSKSGLAKFCGVRPSTVTDWFSGKTRGITGEAGPKAAEYLCVSTRWLLSGTGEKHSTSVVAFDNADDFDDDDWVQIPEFQARCAAGDGQEVLFDEITSSTPAPYRRSWFQSRQINPDNCKRFKVRGTSMEPYIWDGDTILVDCSPQPILSGKTYAFMLNGEMRVKILHPLIRGGYVVQSVNPDVPEERLTDGDLETFRLIGRVRDRSGDGMF